MRRVVPVLFLLLPAGGAFAQGPEPVSLADLLREADSQSPAIQAAAARLEAIQATRSQAEAPPDPEVSLSYLNDGISRFTLGESEFSALALIWTQEMPYRGKLKGAGEIAAFETQKSGKELEASRLEVAAAVKTAYAELYRLDRTGLVLQESMAVLETLVQAARRRYEVGEGIQESVLKAQTEILRLEAEIARVTQDRRTAEVQLNAAVGRLEDVPLGPAAGLPPVVLPESTETLADAAVAASPEVGRLEAGLQGARAGVRLARLNLRPDFVWSLSYQNRDGLDPMVAGMWGVRLPIHRQRKQAQALSQRESELLAAGHEMDFARVQIRAAVRELMSRAQRAERLATLLDQGVIPQSRTALQSAQASYGVGRIAFLDVLNDLTALLGARIELAAQEAERFKAIAALEPLLARDLFQVPKPSPGEGGPDASER